MKILITRKIKRLFCRVLLSFILFTLISVACTLLQLKHAALYVLLSSIGMGLSILAFLYLYFREQEPRSRAEWLLKNSGRRRPAYANTRTSLPAM